MPTIASDPSQINPQDPLDHLSEHQLREVYEAEDINIFLDIFDTAITEVLIPTDSSLKREPVHRNDTLSDLFASFLQRILPPTCPPRPDFTLGRFKVAVQRSYLATVPVYGPFLSRLVSLATWQDRRQSLIYCALYWFLWHGDLLLPAFFLRVLYSLLRRRFLPYPTIEELREHRRNALQANEFKDLTARLSASSSLGLDEVQRIIRIITHSYTSHNKPDTRSNGPQQAIPLAVKLEDTIGSISDPTATIDSIQADPIDDDTKRDLLLLLNGIADIHERIKNIFIWRQPLSSMFYVKVLLCGFIITAFMPARYLAKLVYFLLGACFWHVVPVITALTPLERARIPLPFADVPTDADFAMELISQRVAAGLPVRPDRQPKSPTLVQDTTNPNLNWKRWGGKVATGKAWFNNSRGLLSNEHPTFRSRLSALPRVLTAPVELETHTFPAQHSTAPGLITLTRDTLFFTSLPSAKPTVTVLIDKICAVKKSGLLRGLVVSWESGEGRDVKEERFSWVGGRDEMFALLLGSSSRSQQWLRV